ncbi:MAG TPA: exodeoxyribonuclease VII large subunit [Vicinamibacterales bacterium]|nr:exodeoxyribonuclease VII large subunit [Vicinamibacterales bacterium]
MSDLFSLPFEEDAARGGGPMQRERRIFSVSELTAAIRGVLETGFGEIWVEGELSNCRTWNTGHVYFTLKDEDAQIKAVMFRSVVRYLKFKPEDGMHVIVRGQLGVYEPKGEYQIVCEHLEPRGLGALQMAVEQLKKKLHAEGLFDTGRKRPLPSLPRIIGIVTSLDGAALRDIIKVLRRRHPNAHLLIRPTRVQGDGAAADIAEALRAIVKIPGVDVVIVGRGGGSFEDLIAFNQEPVARAIASSPVPVVSAVGHEVDVTIADFVADLRAPTPSAAAELVVTAKDEFCARVSRLGERLGSVVRAGIQRRRAGLHALSSRRGLAGWHTRLAMRGRHAAELTYQLRRHAGAEVARRARAFRTLRLRLEARDLRRRVAMMGSRLSSAHGRLGTAAAAARHRADSRIASLAGRLENLSPLGVLARGYAVCWNADRTVIIRSADAVAPGDRVRVTLQEGELHCDVRSKDGHGSDNQGF